MVVKIPIKDSTILDLEQTLKQYSNYEKIGSGGFADVYKAQDETGKQIAIKLYDPNKEIEKNFLKLPKHVFDNQGLVRILGNGHTKDGDAYVIKELAKGISLAQLARNERNTLNWNYIASVGIRLCKTAEHLHNHRLLHNDITAQNIVGKQLIDYDLMGKGPEIEGQYTGTASYLVEEELKGKKNEASDIAHITAVMYEMITGQTPLQRAAGHDAVDTELTAYLLVNGVDLQSPKEIPLTARKMWDWIFETGMNPDSKKRPTARTLLYRFAVAVSTEAQARTPIYITQEKQSQARVYRLNETEMTQAA